MTTPGTLYARGAARPIWPALLLFQGAWILCIAAGAGAAPPFVVFAVLAASVLFAVQVLPPRTLPIAVALVLTGWLSDLWLAQIGLFRFAAGSFETTFWLAAIWFSFIVTAPALYRWLIRRPGLAFCVGAVGGTLSYSMASLWGAIAIPSPLAFYTALPLVWGVRMLCVLWFMTCIGHLVTRTGHRALQRSRRPHPFPKGATPCER